MRSASEKRTRAWAKTHFFPRPFDVNLSLLPRLNWRLLPDGGVGMELVLVLCPTNVSLAGIRVKELATDDGVATGYFCHPDFADWCSHTRVQGANRAITVGVANNFFDTAAMEGSCPPLAGTDGWSVGDITWTIPTVWREPTSFFMTRGYRNLSTERQVFTIDAAGTVGVEKFRRKVVRPFGGTASWGVIQ